MNISKAFLVLFTLMFTPAFAGFLEPTSFPTVTADMSFVDRIALQTSGYEQFESEYDANGNCVSGCSYAAPRLEDELAAMERWNALVKTELVEEYDYTENDDGSLIPPDAVNTNPSTGHTESTDFPNRSQKNKSSLTNNTSCSVRSDRFGNRTIPYGSPLGYVSCISSPYKVTRTIFGNTHIHYGIDLRAKTGTPVYAPASGSVVTVFLNDKTCGNGVIIQHANGYSTKYCHFSIISVVKGQTVSAGCLIGRVGNTGFSTGPHLHYAVHKGGNDKKYSVDPERGFIEPHPHCR